VTLLCDNSEHTLRFYCSLERILFLFVWLRGEAKMDQVGSGQGDSRRRVSTEGPLRVFWKIAEFSIKFERIKLFLKNNFKNLTRLLLRIMKGTFFLEWEKSSKCLNKVKFQNLQNFTFFIFATVVNKFFFEK
jgi:hypothetical protein